MMNSKIGFSALLLLASFIGFAQQKTILKGKVIDKDTERGLSLSTLFINDTLAIKTDARGYFDCDLPENTLSVKVKVDTAVFKDTTYTVKLKPNRLNKQVFVAQKKEVLTQDNQWKEIGNSVQIPQIVITKNTQSFNEDQSTVSLLNIVPAVVNDFKLETVLTTLPGVNSNNELSNQYMVRGGSFDENLIYVNGIEIYRPALVRSGNQEGMSFINGTMVDNITFSAGGFSALYGDKMSSALAIDYRNVYKNQTQLQLSFLNALATVDWLSKDKAWSGIASIRYQNNKLLMNRKDDDSFYSPVFMDVQTIVNYKATDQLSFSFLGSIAGNDYKYEPKNKQVAFGTYNDLSTVNIYYNGWEQDKYSSVFGALSSKYKIDYNNTVEVVVSAYHSEEKEFYDMEAAYLLVDNQEKEEDPIFGGIIDRPIPINNGVASQLTHARNSYDALYLTSEIKGSHKIQIKDRLATLSWGLKYVNESNKDRLSEWEIIDSLGYVLPVQNQFATIAAKNNLGVNRMMIYADWNDKFEAENVDYTINLGARAHWWNVFGSNSSNLVFSPRGQVAVKPKYWSKDMKFTFAAGYYQQPPSYREYRGFDGKINTNLKAQKALVFVLGNQYNFKLWNENFSLKTEAYYKHMTDVNVYNIDNVRIRYRADNDAKAYVYGADVRLYGQFVTGTESWISIGYMRAEENYQNKGYISRPTDQRLKFGMLFQDYIKTIPNLKLYLNLVYNTGLPGGGPAYVDSYNYQARLRDYKRADLGFNYVLKDANLGQNITWLQGIDKLQLGLEIYNLFNTQNAITNSWVKDLNNDVEYAVPNYMTARTFNLKLAITF